MNAQSQIQIDLYRMAIRFLGLKEVPGAVHNAHIIAMLRLDSIWPVGDEVPWCSAFVNYVCWLLNVERSKSLAARSWLNVGIEVGLSNAFRGMDVVVLSRGASPTAGHVGFFDRTDGVGQVFLLGGNQGDTVSVAPFSVQNVLGVRRLRWNGE